MASSIPSRQTSEQPMANAGTYGSSQGGGGSGAPPSASTASSGGSFPTGGTGSQLTATQLVESLGVSSTDTALYVTNGQLNQRGQELVAYHNLPEQDRQQIQQAMVQAGLL